MMVLFILMALLIVASACAVVLLKNPIHSALALVLNLVVVAGIYAQLDAHFLAAAQVIVYAGAIMVLVLFVIMLLNFKLAQQRLPRGIFAFSALIVAVLFVCMLAPILKAAFSVEPLGVDGTVHNLGTLIFSRYIYPFEVASLLILTAIVGAVFLARRRHQPVALAPQRAGAISNEVR